MPRISLHLSPRTASSLAGWSCLIGGVGLWAITILVPALIESDRLKADRYRMQVQLRQCRHYRQAYQALHMAIRRDDPMAVAAMAYHQLRLKPSGSRLLYGLSAGEPQVAGIDDWVSESQQLAEPLHIAVAEQSWLTQMVTGPLRPTMIVLGGLCVGYGLIGTDRRCG